MATKKMSAFSADEMNAMKTTKPQKATVTATNHQENSPKKETAEMTKTASTGPDGIHAVRGMSLKINEMLAMCWYTPEDIIRCITPMTRDYSEKQAKVKFFSHLKNMQKHGATIDMTDEKFIFCKDVVLPELQD